MNTPLARVYLPAVTARFAAILNAETKLNAKQEGSVQYDEVASAPEGATSTSWLVFTADAVAAYKRLGAVVTAP